MSFTSLKSGSIRLLFALFITIQANAQLIQTERYEFPWSDLTTPENPTVTPLGKDGVLIYRRILARKNDRIDITKLDTTLHENWRGQITIDKTLRIALVKTSQSVVYFILRSAVYGDFNFTVIAMNPSNGEYLTYRVPNIIPFSITEFVASDRALLLGGYFNYRPVVIYFNEQLGRSQLLPGFFNEPGELTQLAVRSNGEIDVIVSSKSYQRRKVLWIRNYSADGNLEKTTVLESESNKNLMYAKSIRTENGSQVVVGVYGGAHPELGRGLFFASIDDEGKYVMKYYSYGDFENFFKFMKAKRENRIKERIARRKEAGKVNRQSYRFLVHQIIPYKDQFLVLGESFYPRYVYANPYGYYGVGIAGSVVRGDRIFDGYRYTHAVIAAFKKNGSLAWDNAFEMNDIKTFILEQFVRLDPEADKINLLYMFENNLYTKVISENKVLDSKKEVKVAAKNNSDQIKEKTTVKSALEYWYGNNFIATGIQVVSSPRIGGEGGDRKVLFINKVRYQ